MGLINGVILRMNKILLIAYIILLSIALIGWISNIIKLSNCDFEEPYRAEVMHTVGLIPIVGAFTGYMDFGR